jgi:ketosteroid isomerase-like protein
LNYRRTARLIGLATILPMAALAACNANPAHARIAAVLDDQVAAWNRGDIDGFMAGYWKSDELTFESTNGVTKGWHTVLERYKKRYPTQAHMGRLRFSQLAIARTGPDAAQASGRWEVRAAEGDHSGHFYLTLREIDGLWVIVKDRTTSD